SAWQLELVATMQPGTSRPLGNYTLAFEGIDNRAGQNFMAEEGRFIVTAPDGSTREFRPERRVYPASGMPTTEAAIHTYGFSQFYLQLGEAGSDGSHVVRAWFKPYVTLIWLGALLMAAAGVLSLSDRRLRVGAPRQATARPAPAP